MKVDRVNLSRRIAIMTSPVSDIYIHSPSQFNQLKVTLTCIKEVLDNVSTDFTVQKLDTS